ncbi:MAG: DUF3857 domain-containing protein [Sphingobacteriales bacterium]|nr:DUF3857 domain-containing protein [Sphingobacteriales bacterium]MBP9141157.1 DUF3857 domain-containing protein [Chitinophagales bacterium]MDA0198330.1 DUF3857 domain-containing protein [Bacteroidota bacterium]MBK7527946.1 DUF3857 domain-containing protein [Sphingobacteriales bacterium]MBK8678932.1 DUF3857 domain-containing protein [Sphingobacteriales bacterium]
MHFRKQYDEPLGPIPPIPTTDTLWQQADAVILNEEVEWTIRDAPNFTTTINCNRLIKIQTEKGAQICSSWWLPEPLDPAHEQADLPLSERKFIHRPKYFDAEISYFKARVITPNGTVRPLIPTDNTEKETIRYDGSLHHAFAYQFNLAGLKPNDVLQIQYQIYLPYNFDWMRWFFHHSTLPKQQTKIVLVHPKREYFIFNYGNNAYPAEDTTLSAKTTNKRLEWTFKNLPPCLTEPGGNPWSELPHVVWYVHGRAYAKYDEQLNPDYLPYSWQFWARDRLNFKKRHLELAQRRLSEKEVALQKFYETYRKRYPNEKPLYLLFAMHQAIADTFDFEHIDDSFANEDPRLARLPEIDKLKIRQSMSRFQFYFGVFNRLNLDAEKQVLMDGRENIAEGKLEKVAASLKNKTLRTTNRFAIYNGLLARIGENFNITVISDKRIAAINRNICMPVLGENSLFSVQKEQNWFYIYPKRHKLGLAFNELPFYLEGAPAIHIAQMTEDAHAQNNVQFTVTPSSTKEDNTRRTVAKVRVNTLSGDADFDAQVVLSGQFSTMQRNMYKMGIIDSSVNPRYGWLVYDYPDKNLHLKPDSLEINMACQFPFKTTIKAKWSLDNICKNKPNGKGFELNMQQWIKHIVEPNFTAQGRAQAFYPDFLSRDTYTYYIEFDVPISIQAFKDLPFKIENDLGNFKFDIQQVSDTAVQVQSVFEVINSRVPANSAKDVAKLYKLIAESENAILSGTYK